MGISNISCVKIYLKATGLKKPRTVNKEVLATYLWKQGIYQEYIATHLKTSLVKNKHYEFKALVNSYDFNFYNTNSVMNGANQSINSAKNLYRYRSFSEQKDWQDIVRNFNNLQKNLQISQKIENAQKLKIENERSLLEQGRTTTYQILLFEQEYFRSQIKSLEIARQLLSLNAEAKSYKF